MTGTSREGRPRRARGDAAGDAPLALAAVSAAAALSLSRVFGNGSFAVPVVTAALLPHLLGDASRRRRWGPVTTIVVTAAAAAMAMVWMVVPQYTHFGVPGAGAFQALGHRITRGWSVFRTGIAPVPVTPGLVGLCMLATTITSTIADALAFRRHATIGALGPSLLLFVVASTLGTAELRLVTTVAYAATAVVFLVSQQRVLTERRRSWFVARAEGRRSLVGAGVALGAAAIVAGMALGPAIPGIGGHALVDYRGASSGAGGGAGAYRTLSPLVDLEARLGAPSDDELFTVKSPVRLSWRMAALDVFDGRTWGLSAEATDASSVLGRRPEAGTRTVRQDVTIGSMGGRWLPAGYLPVALSLPDARIVKGSRTLVSGGSSVAGLRYTVWSTPPARPTPEQIAATATPVPASLGRDLALPSGLSDEVRRIAESLTRGQTPYGAAMQLEIYFQGPKFHYDLAAPRGASSDAILGFLQSGRGSCEQFAGAFAAMAREVGIPARVAVGFTSGVWDASTRTFSVRVADAHAWPEVWLHGLGWVPFEPTPAGSQPGQADPAAGLPGAAGATGPVAPAEATTSTGPASRPTSAAPHRDTPVSASDPVAAPRSSWRLRTWMLFPALAILFLLAGAARVAVVGLRRARRRGRRRRAPDPREGVTGAWAEAHAHLTRAGVPWSVSATPREQAARVGALLDRAPAAGPLASLAETVTRTLWADRHATSDDADAAWRATDALESAVPIPIRRRMLISAAAAPAREPQLDDPS